MINSLEDEPPCIDKKVPQEIARGGYHIGYSERRVFQTRPDLTGAVVVDLC
jgi:hypothetical protein